METPDKPRIFLGSSGKQAKLLQALTRGLEDVAHVEPWTTSFNPGTTTLERLLELTHEVDFAAFVFAQDDWTSASSPLSGAVRTPPRLLRETTSSSRPASSAESSGCAGPSSSTRAARSFPATSSASPACATTGDDRRGDESGQPEAAEGDRERGPPRAHRGPVVAVLADGAQRRGALRREPPADLARPRRRAGARPAAHGRRTAALSRAILERGDQGEEGPVRASSTTGTENGRWTPTRRSWTGRARSAWSPPIARPGTSRRERTRIRSSTRGPPASTCAPIRRT